MPLTATNVEQKKRSEEEKRRMTMPLEGRVAIVTGASRGIGREIALHLAEKGAKVVVNYSSNQGTAEKVASTINNLASSGDGVRAIVCKADVAEPSQVAQLFDMAEHTFGPLHIVVNNAGILDSKNPTIAQTSDEDWDRTFQVNCKGAFLCSREAAKRVVRGGGGRIINISYHHHMTEDIYEEDVVVPLVEVEELPPPYDLTPPTDPLDIDLVISLNSFTGFSTP